MTSEVKLPEPTRGDRSSRVLGERYELLTAVGRGGMAEVWRARDLLLGRTVAIKLFRGDAGHHARLRVEAVALAALSHPGLVTVFDAVLSDTSSGGDSFLVTEFVEGPNLRSRLDVSAGRGMRAGDVAELGAQIAEALAYVHDAGIVHRDVKPANVLLAPTGGPSPRAKLADFGVALLADGDRLTEHGTVVGTPNYLSPEQLTGAQVGPPCDVYSLGLVLIECLTGAMAYPGHCVEAALVRLQRPPDIPDRFGEQWLRLLTAMVAAEPAGRPTATQVVARLSEITGQATTVLAGAAVPAEAPGNAQPTAVLSQPPVRARPRWRRPQLRRPWLLPACLVAAAVLAVVLIVILSGAPAPSGNSTPGPIYPSVTGQLGRDLTVLQQDVHG